MAGFPWLPIGFAVPDGTQVGRLLSEGMGYQIVAAQGDERVLLLLQPESVVGRSASASAPSLFVPLSTAGHDLLATVFLAEDAPVRVGDIPARVAPLSGAEAMALSGALKRLTERADDASWSDALFLPHQSLCLPTGPATRTENRRELAVRLLTGGVADTTMSPRQIRGFNPWVTGEEVSEFLSAFGDAGKRHRHQQEQSNAQSVEAFALPGRPELEAFFREYVIEYHRLRDRFEAMGVAPPGGVLLYGPPGSGKTFAARALAATLGWPVFEIGLGSVGSPFIHDTTVRLAKAFSEAAKDAPSIVILDEVDAVAMARGDAYHSHKIEEISELLKLVEEAPRNNVLVVATTNRKDAIDRAFLRKGRFDHVLEVGYPLAAEVRPLLAALLAPRPHVAGLNLDSIAEALAGRPVSDAAWVVNEAARIAVKSGKDAIDDICLLTALKRVGQKVAIAG